MRRSLIPPVESDPVAVAHLAHDLRNLLAVVLGHAEMRLEDRPVDEPDPELRRSLEAIQLTAAKAASLCEEVLSLQRATQRGEPEPVRLADTVRAAVRLLEASGPVKASVLLIGSEHVRVRADRSALERAILNLLWNGLEAGRSASGESAPLTVRWGKSPDSAWLEVADRGPGLPGGRIGQMAKPFRTGRESRGGEVRGLGLSTVLATVARFGGRLEGRNAPDGGAVIRLVFPVADHGELSGFPA